MTYSSDLVVEALARAVYSLGDHLHDWDRASEDTRDNYRRPIINARDYWLDRKQIFGDPE